MKKKKTRTMFLSFLALASVFLFASSVINIESVPSVAHAYYYDLGTNEYNADFNKVRGDYDQNYQGGLHIFPEDTSIECTAYRFPLRIGSHNVLDDLTLLRQSYLEEYSYAGKIKISEFEALPGTLANTTPIKGITKIEVTYDGDGRLSFDNRADFAHDTSINLPDGPNTLVFDTDDYVKNNDYPCYFRLEADDHYKNLTLKALKITSNPDLGKVIYNESPSGYNIKRFQCPTDYRVGMPYKVDDNYNILQMKDDYDSEADDNNLSYCVNQLALFQTGIHNSTINRYNDKAYDRQDGYVTAFEPYFKPQTYYEYDLPIDPNFHPKNKRGAGRLVLFPEGLNCPGYENQPFIVFTDDHYFTFKEFLNFSKEGKAVFGPRFDAEGTLTGYKFTPCETVGLPGTGTKEEPIPLNPKITISPNTVFMKRNETIWLDTFFQDICYPAGFEFQLLEQNPTCCTVYSDGRVVSKNNFGHAKVRALGYFQRKAVYSNTIDIYVTDIENITKSGTCQKDYYNGDVFNPSGLTITVNYTGGHSQVVNLDDCIWNNGEPLQTGQTEVICDYKYAITTIAINPVKENLATETLKISLPHGRIVVNQKIDLDVFVTPLGANKHVKWEVNSQGDGYAGDIEENGLLNPHGFHSYIAVSAMDDHYHELAINYYYITDSISYDDIGLQSQLIDEEYVISAETGQMYDPSFTLNNHVRGKGHIDSHNSTARLFIRKSPTPGNYYYIQRVDNHKYIGFNSSDESIELNSINPIDTYIEVDHTGSRIYNKDRTKTFQYNKATKSFGMYDKDSQTLVNLYRRDLYTNSNYIVCDGFSKIWMHMDDYNESYGYCTNWQYQYFSKAMRAFKLLDNKQRLTIAQNTNYAPVWARLKAWAAANYYEIALDSEGNVTFTSNFSNVTDLQADGNLPFILTFSIISGLSFIAFILIKRKHARI